MYTKTSGNLIADDIRKRREERQENAYRDEVISAFAHKYHGIYDVDYRKKYNRVRKKGSNDCAILLGYVLSDLNNQRISIQEAVILRDYLFKPKTNKETNEATEIVESINKAITNRMRIKGGEDIVTATSVTD